MSVPPIKSPDDYARALERLNRLKEQQSKGDDSELAELEGAIAEYVSREEKPAENKGRPKS
ncbi:MAG: hypothetical protein ACTS3R_13610 [Inquilinaceae bacterium]